MGRDSPVRVRGSPPRRSPARRERSRERYKSSRRDESPVRDKRSGRDRSPARELPRSSFSPVRQREPHRGRSPPERERNSAHVKSPRHERSPSASPRTKRLRKAQAGRGSEKVVDSARSKERGTREGSEVEREHERTKVKVDRKQPQNKNEMTDRNYDRNHERGSDRNGHRERGVDRDADNERKERRSRRDDVDGKSSRARHGCSISPVDHHGRSRHKSRSPQSASGARERDEITDARTSERGNSEDDSVARMKAAEEALAQKQQPSFELSGKLAAETNRVKGVTLLFNEPPDARKPDLRWQLFVFKNGEMLNDPLYIHRQSCYLFGRERRVADVPTDHPSCSKQHAVLQFRQVTMEGPDGTTTKKVKPYLMDLGSTNKTFINDSPMEPQRYYELFEKDTIKFGNSSREYVLLHENSAA